MDKKHYEFLKKKSIDSFLLCIEVFNKPTIDYRFEGCVFFLCKHNAGNICKVFKRSSSLFYAISSCLFDSHIFHLYSGCKSNKFAPALYPGLQYYLCNKRNYGLLFKYYALRSSNRVVCCVYFSGLLCNYKAFQKRRCYF